MFLRFFTILLAIFALSGCVLQSDAPLFAEKDGVAALQPLGETFAAHNLIDGVWKEEKDRATFKPNGNHYDVVSDNSVVNVLFVPLQENWWVMQASEQGKAPAYVVAHRDGKAMLLQALFCEDLKKDPQSAARLRFERDDCFAPADFTLAEFKALAKTLPPAKMKLVAE